jgi:hypothetical protein
VACQARVFLNKGLVKQLPPHLNVIKLFPFVTNASESISLHVPELISTPDTFFGPGADEAGEAFIVGVHGPRREEVRVGVENEGETFAATWDQRSSVSLNGYNYLAGWKGWPVTNILAVLAHL